MTTSDIIKGIYDPRRDVIANFATGAVKLPTCFSEVKTVLDIPKFVMSDDAPVESAEVRALVGDVAAIAIASANAALAPFKVSPEAVYEVITRTATTQRVLTLFIHD